MVALFPVLVVIAAVIASLSDVAHLKVGVGEFFDEVLPSGAFALLTGYFDSAPDLSQTHTMRSLLLVAIISVSGASSAIVKLIEGVRRA